ncbi:RCC1 domain-containing protein [Labilithrix luteola]|nr:hypothetical protein [Labilithrix luteola]
MSVSPSPDDVVDAAVDSPPPAIEDASRAEVVSEDAAAPSPPPSVVCPGTGACALALRAPADGTVTPVSEAFCARLATGRVACWGSNVRGELGRGPSDAPANAAFGLPDVVPGLEHATELDRGCALRDDGSVVCWGQLAIPGISDGNTPLAQPTTLPIPPAKKIAAAGSVACAVLANDKMTCFGRDWRSGQLGYALAGGADGGVYGPAQLTFGPGARIVGVAVGEGIERFGGATFALREDGTALSWGMNESLGRVSSFMPDPTPAPVELANVSFVSAGGSAVCAIAGGQVYCWGTRLEPPKALEIYDAIHVATVGPRPLGRGCAVRRDGDVRCWGDNDRGQAGDGTTAVALAPVKVLGLPGPAVAVDVTMKSSCALLADGRVFCWGDGTRGQLGRTFNNGYSPAPLEVALPETP